MPSCCIYNLFASLFFGGLKNNTFQVLLSTDQSPTYSTVLCAFVWKAKLELMRPEAL